MTEILEKVSSIKIYKDLDSIYHAEIFTLNHDCLFLEANSYKKLITNIHETVE